MGTKASSKVRTLVIILCVLIAMILGFAGFVGYRAFFCPLAEGIQLGGVDLSGLSAYEARKTMQASLDSTLYQEALTITLPEETISLSPEDSDVKVNLTKAIRDVFHSETAQEFSLQPYLSVQEANIRNPLLAYASKYDTTLVQPSWTLEGDTPALGTDKYDPEAPCPTIVLQMGVPELHLDVDAVYAQVMDCYLQAVTLCQEGRYTITPKVSPEKRPQVPDVEILTTQFTKAPVNDSLDLETFGFIHGSYGLTFDQEAAEAAIIEASYGETLTFPLEYAQPQVMGEDTYYQDVLGYCETKHTDNENRNTNLRLICESLNGFILKPGEEFSFNGVVGERTKEKGYMPAPAYSGDRLVDSVGGGVCQGSTTLYNSVLLADLEVVTRVCHGAKVNYVKLGLDASVNWGTTDFAFRNNFNFPIKILAELADGYMKMQIVGTDEKDYYIKMEATQGEDEEVIYARSYKCKYDKETDELISRETEAFSTYYKNIG